MSQFSWYQPGYYGSVRGLSGVSVMGWASDPNDCIVSAVFQGSSSAVRAVVARIRMQHTKETIILEPDRRTDMRHNIYGKSWTDKYNGVSSYSYEAFPKSPHPLPDGNCQQRIIRVEDAKIADYICYIDDEKSDMRLLNAIKSITDYPVHKDWIEYLRLRAAKRHMWGVCNGRSVGSFDLRKMENIEILGQSQGGLQYRWIRNNPEIWEEMIQSGFKSPQKIFLPAEE